MNPLQNLPLTYRLHNKTQHGFIKRKKERKKKILCKVQEIRERKKQGLQSINNIAAVSFNMQHSVSRAQTADRKKDCISAHLHHSSQIEQIPVSST